MITLRGDQLDIAVQMQLLSELKNKDIHGLLGNYNGVASDDLVSRNGQTVHANSTERIIYYEFGETCELMSDVTQRPTFLSTRERESTLLWKRIRRFSP